MKANTPPPGTSSPPEPNLRDLDDFQRAVASDRLAEIFTRLAGGNVVRLVPRRPRPSGSGGEGGPRSGPCMDAGRPAALIAWIECESCGRIDKPTHEFNYPEDMAEDASFFVSLPCERCGRQAKLHIRREIKPAH